MDHLARLRETFSKAPLEFDFGPDDPHFKTLQDFHTEQMRLLHDMPSLEKRVKGLPSDTYLHSCRVAEDVRSFAYFIGFSPKVAFILHWAVQLHDIGKLDIPLEILDKPGKLTEEEFTEIKKHTVYGARRIKSLNIDHPILKLACDIAKYHHERHDGRGYFGLAGHEIPSRVRIVQLCDIYDAVSAPRLYRSDKEQLTAYETMRNILDPQGFLYGAVDQRFAIPFCLLKLNTLEGDLSKEHHKMLEQYVLQNKDFSDDDFWTSPDIMHEID